MNFAAMRYLTEGGCPVDGAAWQLLAVIAWHADKTSGEAYVSRRTIATEARLSTSTVHTVLTDLIGRGVLELVVAGGGRRSATYRIRIPASDSPTEPQDLSAGDSPTEPNPNGVVARSRPRSGSIDESVAARLAESPIGMKVEPKEETFEGQPAAAASVDDDPTADAVVVHSPNGQVAGPLDPGLSEATRASLAAVKASIHDQLTADRQAERDRARDLLGPPATEPQETR